MSVAKLRVFRGDSKGGEEKEYEVPVDEGMVVLDALFYIQANYDGDLAVRWRLQGGQMRFLQHRDKRKTEACLQGPGWTVLRRAKLLPFTR